MDDWISQTSDRMHAIFQTVDAAGFVGALVSLRWAPGDKTWVRVSNVVCGWAAAHYLTIPLTKWLDFDSVRSGDLGVAFFVGMFSMNISASVLDYVRTGKWAELLPWKK